MRKDYSHHYALLINAIIMCIGQFARIFCLIYIVVKMDLTQYYRLFQEGASKMVNSIINNMH